MPNPTPFPAPADDLRLVVSDMDGTLLDGDGNIPSQLWPLLETMRDRAIAFVPASGRQCTTLSTMFGSHLQGMPIIAENGTYVVRDGVDISSSTIDPNLTREVITGVRQLRNDGHDVGLVVATKSIAYLERGDDPFVSHVATYYHSHRIVKDLSEHTDDVIKLSIYDFREASEATYLRVCTSSRSDSRGSTTWVRMYPNSRAVANSFETWGRDTCRTCATAA